MTYSVWDWNKRQFAVYQDQRQRPLMGDPGTCTPAVRAGIGGMVDIGAVLCPLPRDAQPLGWSEVAVGQVVRAATAAQPASHGSARGRAPGLGMLFAPSIDGGGAIAGVGLGELGQLGQFSFSEAVIVNVVVSVVAGLVSNYVFKSAFMGAGKKV